MVTNSDLENFVNDESYVMALNELSSIMDININTEKSPRILLDYNLNRILMSGASLSDLKKILREDLTCFVKYVKTKLDLLLNELDEQEGQDDDEKDCLVERLPFYKSFLIIHLLEFFY